MRAVNDLRAKFDSDLTFVSNGSPLASKLIQGDISLLAVNDYDRGLLSDYKPLLQIPLPAIQVSLVFRSKPLSFELLPNLAARDTIRISLQNLHDSKVDLAGPADACCLAGGSHRAPF